MKIAKREKPLKGSAAESKSEEKGISQFSLFAEKACKLALKRKHAANRIYWNQIRERIASH